MRLNKDWWFVRLFFWSLGLWAEFNPREDEFRYEEGTNLCHFIRVIVVYMPLVLLSHLLLIVAVIGALIATPIYFWGTVNYFIIVAGIAALIVIPIGMKKVTQACKMKRPQQEEKERVERREPKGPGALEVVKTYLVAKKKKICPTIEFSQEGGM